MLLSVASSSCASASLHRLSQSPCSNEPKICCINTEQARLSRRLPSDFSPEAITAGQLCGGDASVCLFSTDFFNYIIDWARLILHPDVAERGRRDAASKPQELQVTVKWCHLLLGRIPACLTFDCSYSCWHPFYKKWLCKVVLDKQPSVNDVQISY